MGDHPIFLNKALVASNGMDRVSFFHRRFWITLYFGVKSHNSQE
jgi:hypothetical protein